MQTYQNLVLAFAMIVDSKTRQQDSRTSMTQLAHILLEIIVNQADMSFSFFFQPSSRLTKRVSPTRKLQVSQPRITFQHHGTTVGVLGIHTASTAPHHTLPVLCFMADVGGGLADPHGRFVVHAHLTPECMPHG